MKIRPVRAELCQADSKTGRRTDMRDSIILRSLRKMPHKGALMQMMIMIMMLVMMVLKIMHSSVSYIYKDDRMIIL